MRQQSASQWPFKQAAFRNIDKLISYIKRRDDVKIPVQYPRQAREHDNTFPNNSPFTLQCYGEALARSSLRLK